MYGFPIDLARGPKLAWHPRTTTHFYLEISMKPLRHCLAIASWILLFASLTVAVSFAQGSKRVTEYDSIEDRDRDNPGARDEWFMRGRTTAEDESPAMLRYRAYQPAQPSQRHGFLHIPGRRDEIRFGNRHDSISHPVGNIHGCDNGNGRDLYPDHYGNPDMQ